MSEISRLQPAVASVGKILHNIDEKKMGDDEKAHIFQGICDENIKGMQEESTTGSTGITGIDFTPVFPEIPVPPVVDSSCSH